MASPGDLIRVRGLMSEQVRKLNSCLARVVASVNAARRITVIPFSDGDERPIPFDEANAIRVNLLSVISLPNDFGTPWVCLYRASLQALVEARKIDFSFLPTRNSVRNEGRF